MTRNTTQNGSKNKHMMINHNNKDKWWLRHTRMETWTILTQKHCSNRIVIAYCLDWMMVMITVLISGNMAFRYGYLPVVKHRSVATWTRATHAHHCTAKKRERNSATKPRHHLRIVRVVLVSDLSCQTFQKTCAQRSNAPEVEKTNGQKESWSTLMTRSSYSSCFSLWWCSQASKKVIWR